MIDIEPWNATTHRDRGDAYYELKQVAAQIADYSQAIALQPQSAVDYRTRGNAYYQQGRYTEALSEYSTRSRLIPPTPGHTSIAATRIAP